MYTDKITKRGGISHGPLGAKIINTSLTVPRNIIQTLIEDVQNFNDSILGDIKHNIQFTVDSPNTIVTGKELFPLFNALENLSNTFDGLKTEYFRLQMLEEMGFLVRPKQIVIAHRLNDQLQDGIVVLKPKPVEIILTPLRYVLKQLFEHSNFFDVILNYTKQIQAYDGKFIYSFLQSKIWKTKLKLHQNKTIFPLFLYFDDLDINR